MHADWPDRQTDRRPARGLCMAADFWCFIIKKQKAKCPQYDANVCFGCTAGVDACTAGVALCRSCCVVCTSEVSFSHVGQGVCATRGAGHRLGTGSRQANLMILWCKLRHGTLAIAGASVAPPPLPWVHSCDGMMRGGAALPCFLAVHSPESGGVRPARGSRAAVPCLAGCRVCRVLHLP